MSLTHKHPITVRRPALALFFALLVMPALACAGGPTTYPDLDAGPASGLLAPSGDVVYVNGSPLTAYERAQIEALIGHVPAGRYWLDQNGYFGAEGGPALVNLVQALDQMYGSGSYSGGSGGGSTRGGWMDYGPFGSSGGDGETCYYNDPETGASVIVPCSN